MPFSKDDVAQFRTVNGKQVVIDDIERQTIADEWNVNEAEREDRETVLATHEGLNLEDVERLLKELGVTTLQIRAAKRDRGKVMP